MKTLKAMAVMLLAIVTLVGCVSFPQHALTQGQSFRDVNQTVPAPKRVAILGLENDPLFQQSLTIAFLNRGIDVVEREKIDRLLTEGEVVKAWSDLADVEKAKALGRLLKVDALVLAGVMHEHYFSLNKQQVKLNWAFNNNNSALQSPFPNAYVGAEYGMAWRIIDVATGSVISVGDRIFTLRQKAKKDNLNSLTAMELIRYLCNEVVTDATSQTSGIRDAAVKL